MFAKAFRLSLGILLIPLGFGYAIAFYEQLAHIRKIQTPEVLFLLGVTAYLAFHVLVAQPSRAYVFGHELMHASATWLSGGMVKGFRFGKDSGSVVTDRINALIALAPYLVPVYSLLLAFLYGVAGLFWNVAPYSGWFFFALGATLTFHLAFTINALKQGQADLDLLGPVLSLVLVFLGNITLVVVAMGLLIPEVRLWAYLADGFRHSQHLYQRIFAQLFTR